MKRGTLFFLLVVLLLPPVRAFSANELLWEKKLPFQEAAIHYHIKGMEEGKETLYVRENGKERAIYRETVSHVMGVEMVNSTVTIKQADFIYTYDLQKKQGFKAVNPQKYMIEAYNKLSPAEQEKVRESARKMGAAYTEGMGGTMEVNAVEILGYNCDKVEIMDGSATYLIHDTDVALKTEMNIMGTNLIMTAETVKKGKVDDKFFRHPEGIIAEVNAQSDEIAKNMAMQAIALLQDPQNTDSGRMMAPMQAVDGTKKKMSKEDKEAMMQQMEQVMKGLQQEKTGQ